MFLVIISVFAVCTSLSAQSIFEINYGQSMLMTGKGPGQDATINPFQGGDCFALIENLGEEMFSVRIQENGKVIGMYKVKPNKKFKIKLITGQELYLDSETKNQAKARVTYERLNK